MSLDSEIRKLEKLSLEEKAGVKEKSFPLWGSLIISLCGIVLGVYYWMIDDLIFSYITVAPFWGFVLFLVIGVSVSFISNKLYGLYWSKYNDKINEANNEIIAIVENNVGNQEDLFRLKKGVIERKIPKGTLTQEEFEWHSSNFCWGCGKEHVIPPSSYIVTKEKTKSWQVGRRVYTGTYKESALIFVCPECYDRLIKADNSLYKIQNINPKIYKGFIILTSIIMFVVALVLNINRHGDVGEAIFYGVWAAFSGAIVTTFAGLLILFTIGVLSSLVHRNRTKSKWDFNQIPKIRHFLDGKLPF